MSKYKLGYFQDGTMILHRRQVSAEGESARYITNVICNVMGASTDEVERMMCGLKKETIIYQEMK